MTKIQTPVVDFNAIVNLPTKKDLIAYWDAQTAFNKINKKGLKVGSKVWIYRDVNFNTESGWKHEANSIAVEIVGFNKNGLIQVKDMDGNMSRYGVESLHLNPKPKSIILEGDAAKFGTDSLYAREFIAIDKKD